MDTSYNEHGKLTPLGGKYTPIGGKCIPLDGKWSPVFIVFMYDTWKVNRQFNFFFFSINFL